MFSHVMIGTNDLERAKRFYDALLGTLGIKPAVVDGHRIFYRSPTGLFSVSLPIDGQPATAANGATLGFAASSPAWVMAALQRHPDLIIRAYLEEAWGMQDIVILYKKAGHFEPLLGVPEASLPPSAPPPVRRGWWRRWLET